MPANYVLLERIELNASAASVTFSNIPQTGYTDLKIVASARTNRANAVDAIAMYYNGDTTFARYTAKELFGDGSAAGSLSWPQGNDEFAYVSGDSATANTFGNTEIYIPNYAGSTQKSASADSVGETNATTIRVNLAAGLYNQTTAISSITLKPVTGTSFLANSTFSLYGLAAVGSTPAIAPKASGGNITTDGTYWYHTFLASGTFTPQTTLTCDYLVIAGGGGGGFSGNSGGGGAGGYRLLTNKTLTSSNYSVAVGAGGAGGVSYTTRGINGNNSSINADSATGGGAGGTQGQVNGSSGGSGGGGSGATFLTGGTGNAGSYTPVEGYAGGTGLTNGSSYYNGGGGGGAGAVGANATSTTMGAGGAGSNSASSWATATSTGVSGYYAGGGGAGGDTFRTVAPGAGGSGGGGAGGNGANGVNGTTNTGSGGGGGDDRPLPEKSGGSGGSGIVIVRYTIA